MASLATLHIRNVPDDVVETLKRRARVAGRSLNAEVVHMLTESATRPKRTVEEVLDSVRRRAAATPGPPAGEEIAVEIRRARDERSEQIERAILGECRSVDDGPR